MKYHTNKIANGFTLVELSITIVISSIIALSAGSLVLISSTQYTLSTIDTQTIRDHALITRFLSQNIKEGLSNNSYIYTNSSQSTPVSSGSCIQIMAPDSSKKTFFKDGNDLVLENDNGQKKEIVRQILTGLTFTESYAPDSTRLINVTLTTVQNGSPVTTNHHYSFRN